MTPYVGEIRIFAGRFAPSGWAFCDGSTLPIATNQVLYSLIGVTWGGDGVNNFKLPDLRGRLPVGQGQGTGLTARTIGQMAGQNTVTLTADQLPAHTHVFLAGSDLATSNSPGPTVSYAKVQNGDVLYVSDSTNTTALNAAAVSTTSGGQAHNNQMPALSLNYIIALAGVYPQQA